MVSETNKRPPRQPLSPEEVMDMIKLKKLRQYHKTEKFKKTKSYKYLNLFNIVCIVVYTEIIFSFLSSCNYRTMYIETVTPYYGEDIVAGKRVVSSAVFKTVYGNEYDVGIRDTCTMPLPYTPLLVGRDWILQKDIKVKFDAYSKEFFIKRSFPLLFISILLGIVTFVLFGYNLNQNPYSLNVISFINSISIIAFLLF